MGRRRRRRGGFFRRIGRALSRVGRGIRKNIGKIAGVALGPLGVIAGHQLDKRIEKKKRERPDRKRRERGKSNMPKKMTKQDFIDMGKQEMSPIQYHWNPKDGWILDLNGNGKVGLEDFKLAVYPEHKKYIRDHILANQFSKNKYLDINGDGVVDLDDWMLAKDDEQKREIQKYVEDKGGTLSGNRITNLVIHMVDINEKAEIFSYQNQVGSGLRGKDSDAAIRNIEIDQVLEYHEGVKKYGTDVGRAMIRGVVWRGDDDSDSIKEAISVIKKKLPDRYARFFDSKGFPKRLRGQRGTIFNIKKRADSTTVDVVEEQQEIDENGYVLVISGDFEYGDNGDSFFAHEELEGMGDLKGKVRVGAVKPKPPKQIIKRKKPTRRPSRPGKKRITVSQKKRTQRRKTRRIVKKVTRPRIKRRTWRGKTRSSMRGRKSKRPTIASRARAFRSRRRGSSRRRRR